jgi:hypothetical protein
MPGQKPKPAAIGGETTLAGVRTVAGEKRQKARQCETDAAEVRYRQATMRERLLEIDEQLAWLRRVHLREGDALAGRLQKTLERERTAILSKLKPELAPSPTGRDEA